LVLFFFVLVESLWPTSFLDSFKKKQPHHNLDPKGSD